MFFYSDADPFGVDVDFQLRSLQMLWYLDLKEGIIWVLVLFEAKFVLTFVALPDLSFFCVHLDLFLWLVFFRIFLSLFSFLISCHFLVHLFSRLPSIWRLELSFFFLSHMLLYLLPLLDVMFLLPQL